MKLQFKQNVNNNIFFSDDTNLKSAHNLKL